MTSHTFQQEIVCITAVLETLHLLPVDLKILMTTLKARVGLAPEYLHVVLS